MSGDLVPTIANEIDDLISPLVHVVRADDPPTELRALLDRCGWIVTTDVDVDAVIALLDGFFVPIQDFITDPVPDSLGELVDLLADVATVIDDMKRFGDELAALGDPVPTSPTAPAALAEDLVHHLAIEWIRRKADIVRILEAVGLVERVDVDREELAWVVRPAGRADRVRPAALIALLDDPVATVTTALAPDPWDTADEAAQSAMLALRMFGPLLIRSGAWRLDPHLFDPRHRDDAPGTNPTLRLGLPPLDATGRPQIGAALELIARDRTTASGAAGPALQINPFGSFEWNLRIGRFDLAASAALLADPTGAPIEIGPGGDALAVPDDVSIEVTAETDLDLMIGAGGTGLRLGRLHLSLGMDVDDGGADLSVAIAALDSALQLSTADFGSAIATLVPLDVDLPFDLGLEFRHGEGFRLYGEAGLSIFLGDLTFAGGAFSLLDLTLDVSLGDPVSVGVTGDIAFDLTVFAARLDGVGLDVQLSFPASGGNLGGAELALAVVPPTRLGLEIRTDAVTGGGFLLIEPTRYAGAISLQIIEVGINAVTVIDTALPGNPDGWAFFASLSLEFPSIPLGFGFTLSGLGGVIALNRGLDTVAMAADLRNGVIDGLMFPDEPLADAAALIAQIDDYFPIDEGNTVVGPVIEIGWGAPSSILTAQLGVLISFPEGVIGIIGSISAVLPVPEAPLMSLRLDSIGEVDLPAGTLLIAATLYDSNLLGTIELSGDMGMYLATRGTPYFLLSVGGYHPTFTPPNQVPAPLHDLRRMRAAIEIASNVNISIEAYFAVTSNTVQFGASVALEASVEIWPTTYTARGEVGFDILIQFSPFAIIADIYAEVGVYSGNKELMGVHLSAHLEGPEPWFASALASFKFFGVKVKFEIEVGGKAADENRPLVEIRGDVIAALSQISAWEEAAPFGVPAAITYIDMAPTDDDVMWVRPDHSLVARQGVAPLERALEVIGEGTPHPDHTYLRITAAGFMGDAQEDPDRVTDWFAPAMFERMSDQGRLSRESYEEMTAGVSFGSDEVEISAHPRRLGREVEVTYEESLYDPDPPTFGYEAGAFERSVNAGMAGAAHRFEQTATTEPAFVLGDVAYTVVAMADGVEAGDVLAGTGTPAGGVAQSAALAAMSSRTTGSGNDHVAVVPAAAAVAS